MGNYFGVYLRLKYLRGRAGATKFSKRKKLGGSAFYTVTKGAALLMLRGRETLTATELSSPIKVVVRVAIL